MCFDILRSKAGGGTWDPGYTISCLFASLMQAIVTTQVPQEYGGEIYEFVSMEKLDDIKRSVNETYMLHHSKFPILPTIPTIPATSVKASALKFTHIRGQHPATKLYFNGVDTFVSDPFYLQKNDGGSFSALLDLRDLHPGVVFSVILSNQPGTDHIGKLRDTILLRNGVTGTAAKKVFNRPLRWFYHGKPLNEGDLLLYITVTQDQFTMAYKSNSTQDDKFLVHGDTPISKLGPAQIGNVDGVPFYLSLFLKLKHGTRGFITTLDQRGIGYVHGGPAAPLPSGTVARRGPPPVFVRLGLDGEQTSRLSHILDFYEVGREFQVKRSVLDVAHQTLLHRHDMTSEHYLDVINEIYKPLEGQAMNVSVEAIVADNKCVAFLTANPLNSNGTPLPFFPRTKLMHITMRLRDASVRPVYANTLAQRIMQAVELGEPLKKDETYIQLPQSIKLFCPLQFHFNS